MLHNDKELFEQIILLTSYELGIEPGIVEKDYYVTLVLKNIALNQPHIVFRGGTSLSKCYKIINRFSEDIDLNISGEAKPSEGVRKKLKDQIISSFDSLDLTLSNSNNIYSRRDYNRYIADYSSILGIGYRKPQLIIETAVFFRSYPNHMMEASSFIFEYLVNHHLEDLIETYDLMPFSLNVQDASRTFVDKLFALGDYYLSGKISEHSRHIYDLYKLLDIVELDDTLQFLALQVKNERKSHKTCLSAQDDINMNSLLQEIIDCAAYKQDYDSITSTLLFEPVDYATAITSLEKVIAAKIF